MSHLRAPAARADRREGGRHGRPVTRTVPSLPETRLRPQLLRLAVLPPTSVALSAGAAVLFTVRSTGARPGPVLWAVLAGAFAVTVAGIAIAAVAAGRAARSVHDRIGVLRRGTEHREAELRGLVEALRRGDTLPRRKPHGGPPEDTDEIDLLAADLARAHDGALAAVVHAAQLSSRTGSEQKLEVFVNLARRLQSLVHREISILDELENDIEDPDLLKGIFHVDHLATRVRRHAENLAVLGGAVSRRQWSNPVCMTEVLRSAIAEVEQYSRVKLAPPIEGRLRGHAVADVIHLVAELVENATLFSAPQTQVLLRASLVTSGLAVEVEDRGLGMPVGEQLRMNALLADPDQVNVASLLADGRIGLYVVSQLARRHGVHVRLQTNIYGGVQAVVVLPQALLGASTGASGTSFGALDTGARPAVPGPYGGPPALNGGGAHRAPTVSGRPSPNPATGLVGAPARPGDTRQRDGGMHPVASTQPPGVPAPHRPPGTPGAHRPPVAPHANGATGPATPMSAPQPGSGDGGRLSVSQHGAGDDGRLSVPLHGAGDDGRLSVPLHGAGDAGRLSTPPPAVGGGGPESVPPPGARYGGPTPMPGPGVGEGVPAPMAAPGVGYGRSAPMFVPGAGSGMPVSVPAPAPGGDTPVSVPAPVARDDIPGGVPAPVSGGDTSGPVAAPPFGADAPSSMAAPLSRGDAPSSVPASVFRRDSPMAVPAPVAEGGTPFSVPAPASGGDMSGPVAAPAFGAEACSSAAAPLSGGDAPSSVPASVFRRDTPVAVPAPVAEGDMPFSVPAPVSGGHTPFSVPAPASGGDMPFSMPAPVPGGDAPIPVPASMPGGESLGPGGDLLPAPASPGGVRPGESGAADRDQREPLEPLPRRIAREGHDNPAEAVPGIRPADRAAVAANAGAPPVPRGGAVRGIMAKPQLPRRRAQEHLVPQLRDAPVSRQESGYVTGHDPGLMAAFQRGMGLAESEQRREPGPAHEPHSPDAGHPAYPLDASGPAEARPVLLPGRHRTVRHDGSEPAG
ncbi:ATP-binding protein [Streptomyces sp. NPDC094153]|uniref:sensor histidine kinase n=1 Tax=Streptomyces sp. NPDC094153 TaxID=3366058 RepID=UPI0038021D38